MKRTLNYFGLWSLLLVLLVSCGDDDDGAVVSPDPIASFQFEVDDTNFFKVDFTNFSQNAESYAWDFGDGNSSTEENPSHTYDAEGTYTVKLTASNASGASSGKTETVEISDPNTKLTLLAGTDSKTWKLIREGTSMLLASGPDPSAADYQVFWPGNSNDGSRPCLYDDEFTFTRDGSYIYNDNGSFWGEFGVFDGTVNFEKCFDATAANMVNKDGVDVSAWLSGTHSYSYDATNNTITLTGEGAWIGIPKLGTSEESTVPASEVKFNATVVDGGSTGVDTLYVNFSYDGAFWPFTYVSYADPSVEPAIVSVKADFGAAANGLTVNFENKSSGATTYSWDFGDGGSSTEENPSHTYAAEGSYDVTLTASDGSSSNSVTKSVSVSAATLTDPAPTPTEPEANVISIYSDAYTDITDVNTNPNWGQATTVTEETVQSDNVLLLSNLNYQGIDFSGNQQDVSGKTFIHLDIWSASEITINFSLISPGPNETPYSITTQAGAWTSLDIALTEFSSVVNLTEVFQMKFDDAGSGSSPSFYVDNIYFY
ncbi:PKD domain-containing protein [Fulvivirga sp. RKSG066]|uniref:PKD domain-containing protein n=1 Tax=Fulvivirga aurantia TaxID=2529383 RepID=UPI0012BB5A92|nr:PKD domain-containing protein [Fulvivirga aurantia]MTI22812.1 PKD domain-containing protein [Fulvivirga aurantia]